MSEIKKTRSCAPADAAAKAFPSARDGSAWASLSAAEKRAIVTADEAAGFASGVAPQETVAARIARVRETS